MESENLIAALSQLTPEEQAAVWEFIKFLKREERKPEASAFLAAIDEFIAEHPELLHRLAI